MAHPSFPSRVNAPAYSSGTWLIVIGLSILIIAAWLPAAPVVTAIAILALGATNATIARFQGTPGLNPIILLHAATYATLYALFIGATLHTAAVSSSTGLNHWQALDLAASVLPMAVAMQRMGGMLSRRGG